jgi:hypothetical protein
MYVKYKPLTTSMAPQEAANINWKNVKVSLVYLTYYSLQSKFTNRCLATFIDLFNTGALQNQQLAQFPMAQIGGVHQRAPIGRILGIHLIIKIVIL